MVVEREGLEPGGPGLMLRVSGEGRAVGWARGEEGAVG